MMGAALVAAIVRAPAVRKPVLSFLPVPTVSGWPARVQARSAGAFLQLLEMALLAAAMPLVMRLPLPVLAALVEPRAGRRHGTKFDVERIVQDVEVVLRLWARVVRPTCIPRGLLRYRFLRRAGLDVSLVFGLGRAGGRYRGHCWLVRRGAPFLETWDPRLHFVETYRFTSRRPRADG